MHICAFCWNTPSFGTKKCTQLNMPQFTRFTKLTSLMLCVPLHHTHPAGIGHEMVSSLNVWNWNTTIHNNLKKTWPRGIMFLSYFLPRYFSVPLVRPHLSLNLSFNLIWSATHLCSFVTASCTILTLLCCQSLSTARQAYNTPTIGVSRITFCHDDRQTHRHTQ